MSPYIKQDRRKIIEDYLEEVGTSLETKGELTYSIYKLGIEYMKNHKTDYQNLSDICASMRDAEHEFRRKILDGYENIKEFENGDII